MLKGLSGFSSFIFHVNPSDIAGDRKPVGKPSYKILVPVGLLCSQQVIYMGNTKFKRKVMADLPKNKKKGNRVNST
jgi:hypothetical protein